MMFTLSRRKIGRKVFYNYRKRKCYTVNSHVKNIKTNNLNTSNSDNVKGNSNLPRINVQTKSPFNTLINLQKGTDAE